MAKYTMLRQRILETDLIRSCDLRLPPAANDEQLLLVHTVDYLNAIKSGELSDLQIRRIGFPWSPKMVERSRRSTGATIAAGRDAIRDGIAANLAGGTHHAFANTGQGYCVFNDTCVAAKVLQQQGLVNNVLVVDCDVHQGNGTAGIAVKDPTLFAFSVHCDKNYPFQKTAGDIDIALPPATGDEAYLEELETGLNCAFREFQPDIVFYLAGADPYKGDRLGMLNLTKRGLQQRDQLVIDYCRQRSLPVAISMAGGYAPELNDIVDIHFATIETALDRYRSERVAG